MRIAYIGFGEAGQAFAASLAAAGAEGQAAHDRLFGTEAGLALADAAERLGLRFVAAPDGAVAGADIVVSAVTAASTLGAAQAIAPALSPGQVVIDINSASPGRKAEAAALIRAAGAGYVDMAVMGPVHPRGHQTAALVAGDIDGKARAALDRYGFAYDEVGPEPGAATAVKMIRSLFVKGLEALTVQTLSAAAATGCHERVLRSLAATYPGLDWPGFPAYQFERVSRHGLRRAEEMEESARTYAEAGFDRGAALARAVAGLQRAGAGEELPGDALAAAAALLARRLRDPATETPEGEGSE